MSGRSQEHLREREWADYTDSSGHKQTLVAPVSTAGGGTFPAPPFPLTPGQLTGTPVVSSTLTVTAGAWSGTPPLTITRQWQRDANTFISGATGLTYVVQAADAGHDI